MRKAARLFKEAAGRLGVTINMIFKTFGAARLKAFLAACSFLTILPVPRVGWTDDVLRHFIAMMPMIGALLGAMWAAAFGALSACDISANLRGALAAVIMLALTGGLHTDGLMDTCDAIFSRRDRETRLKILSDTHAGSFAVIGCVSVMLLRSAAAAEIFSSGRVHTALLFAVPIWSRCGMGFMMNCVKFAKDDGLARALGSARSTGTSIFLTASALTPAAVIAALCGVKTLAVPLICLLTLALWIRCCMSVFGGITGDLVGAFCEISETAMLLTAAVL